MTLAPETAVAPAADASFGRQEVEGRDGGPQDFAIDCRAIISRMRASAGVTQPWYWAVLQAIGEWTLTAETVNGRWWTYVIGGEALDWLTLAQRLVGEITDAVPPADLEMLLFQGRLPSDVGGDEFRRCIGAYRYTAHLNFWYGVTVEEALQLAVEDKIRKNHLALCYQDTENVVQEAFRHLYGQTQMELVGDFLRATGNQWAYDPESMSLTAYREFTYWLFKMRIHKWHPARVASDTRRGLEKLLELRSEADPLVGDNPMASGYAFPARLPAP
jgi:hypothetical protein